MLPDASKNTPIVKIDSEPSTQHPFFTSLLELGRLAVAKGYTQAVRDVDKGLIAYLYTDDNHRDTGYSVTVNNATAISFVLTQGQPPRDTTPTRMPATITLVGMSPNTDPDDPYALFHSDVSVTINNNGTVGQVTTTADTWEKFMGEVPFPTGALSTTNSDQQTIVYDARPESIDPKIIDFITKVVQDAKDSFTPILPPGNSRQ